MKQELIDEMISELEAMERLVRRQFPEFVHPLIAKLRADGVSGGMPKIGCVQHDCDECKKRAAQRQQLTPREIAAFVGTHEFGPEQLKWFRFGEAAHGIGSKT